MVKTVPNQYIVKIKKTTCKTNFLQISNSEWQQAAQDCGRSFGAFKLYLYLAANELNYEKALSPAAFKNALGLEKTAYYESVNKLIELGYLVPVGKNRYDFYTCRYEEAPSAQAENSVREENKIIKNSAQAEKVDLSVQAENSAQAENKINSVIAENSVQKENSVPAENIQNFMFEF